MELRKIWDMVDDAIPEAEITLQWPDVDPQNVIGIQGAFSQTINRGLGVSKEVLSDSETPVFNIVLTWSVMSAKEHDFLFDFYFSKVFGAQKSFYYKIPNPYDSDIHKLLVVRIISPWESMLRTWQKYSIPELILEVEGRMGAGTTTTTSSTSTTSSSSSSSSSTAP